MTLSSEPHTPIGPHDRQMLALVRPKGWNRRLRDDVYDLVAVGGGTAGMVASAGAALLGARSAMIERALLGGDCLVTGCVPSKALLRAAHAAHAARKARDFGIDTSVDVDFGKVMERLRATRAQIAHNDSAQAFTDRGVDVIFGQATFTGPRSLEVDGRPVHFKRAVIATGGRPFLPPIPGIDGPHVLTSDTLFQLTEAPAHLVVIGGGPMGCELGQAMGRLGVRVTVIEMTNQLLPREDPDVSRVMREVLEGEGISLRLNTRVSALSPTKDGLSVRLDNAEEISCEKVLVAAGRVPNVEGLGLEKAGVEVDSRGIQVDQNMRTRNRRIYATGDVASAEKFTHVAYAQSEYALFNALFPVWFNAAARVAPRVMYTEPEVAHVGLDARAIAAMGDAVQTFEVPATEVDRLVIDGDARGFAKIHVRRGTGEILACTIVCPAAGELIGEVGLAMTRRLGLGAIGDTIHAYPTRSELVRKLADAYNEQRLTPRIRRLLKAWFSLLR